MTTAGSNKMTTISNQHTENASQAQLGFLRNGGTVAQLLRDQDEAASPLGHVLHWPPSLKTLLATILPSSAQIVLFWGADYVALYNDAYVPTIGTKHPRALGRPAKENWHELWDDLEPLLRSVRETGMTFSATDRPFYIERRGLGETAYFDVSYSAVRGSDGETAGVLCIVTETTERVQFQQRHAFLLALGQVMPLLGDPDRIGEYAIQRVGEELGASRVSLLEQYDVGNFRIQYDWLPSRSGACGQADETFAESLLERLRTGESVRQDRDPGDAGNKPTSVLYVPLMRASQLEGLLIVHFHGQHRVLDSERQLLEEAGKQVWAALIHARAERALKASSAQLSAMFEQASAGIVLCDSAWQVTKVNDCYCEMVGRTRETLLGARLPEIPDDLGPAADPACCGQVSEITRRHVRPDGRAVWIQLQITPLFHEQDQLAGMLCMCIDVTAGVEAQAELVALNESLEERVSATLAERESTLAELHEARKMEMIGQLTGGIAHDFNNMLTPIVASLELIRTRHDDPRTLRLTDGALQAAERARNLVGRLLSFARRQTLKPQAISLAALVKEMGELISRSLGPTIDVTLDIPESLPAVVVDPHQLELALLNLVVNARDAMASGGNLNISAGLEQSLSGRPERVWLMVSDDGSGMSEEVLKRCIEPFYSTKQVGKGTGLGLPMVQGLALQSQGDFSIHSTLGQGTEAIIWLPVSQTRDAGEGERAGPAPLASMQASILLVDDEQIVRHATALQLRHLGYQVTEAASALEAKALVDAGLQMDILLTDHVMPNMTGAQLARMLRQARPRLPVLILSGYANLSPHELLGFEVLGKPFRRDELVHSLQRLLPGAQAGASSGSAGGTADHS